jgi:mannose-6-phosphate isomerase-like protein (cupin superfamily)
MQPLPLTVIDIEQLTVATPGGYLNLPLALVNDHVVRVSVMTEPFYWHLHPNSDETFLVVEGSLFIDLPSQTIELLPGQLFTVPRNTKHRTRPKAARSVNLTFEHQQLETIRVDE